MTQVSPVLVLLNGDTTAAPAEPYKALVPVVGQEVAISTTAGRRLIVWAAP